MLWSGVHLRKLVVSKGVLHQTLTSVSQDRGPCHQPFTCLHVGTGGLISEERGSSMILFGAIAARMTRDPSLSFKRGQES